jgi:hypothetical protein
MQRGEAGTKKREKRAPCLQISPSVSHKNWMYIHFCHLLWGQLHVTITFARGAPTHASCHLQLSLFADSLSIDVGDRNCNYIFQKNVRETTHSLSFKTIKLVGNRQLLTGLTTDSVKPKKIRIRFLFILINVK